MHRESSLQGTQFWPEVQEELQELKRRRRDEEEFENRETKRVAQQQVGKKVGDPGYRYHARVLRATRPDYIKAPEVPEAVCSFSLASSFLF
jgi:hypothetical protein